MLGHTSMCWTPCFQFFRSILRSEIAGSTPHFLYVRHCAVYFMLIILFNFLNNIMRRYILLLPLQWRQLKLREINMPKDTSFSMNSPLVLDSRGHAFVMSEVIPLGLQETRVLPCVPGAGLQAGGHGHVFIVPTVLFSEPGGRAVTPQCRARPVRCLAHLS